MMPELSDEHDALRALVREFANAEIEPHAAEWDRTHEFPVATVLAMGELIGHLDTEQDRARAEFDTAFATFARPAGVQRLLHLGGHR